MTTSNQGISIIISVFGQNSEVNLLLKQLINSNTKYKGDYEIIVIGDGYEVKLDDDLKSEKIKYFYREKNFGSGLSRHFGVLKSKFNIITFLDADTELHCDFLEIINSKLQNSEKLSGIIGVVDGTPVNKKSLSSRFLAQETNYYGLNCKELNHNFFIAQCGAIKKDIYFKNLGFYHRIIDDM